MQQGLERSRQRSRRKLFRPAPARDIRQRPATATLPLPEASLGERIRLLNSRILEWVDALDDPADLVCECTDPRCFSVVTTTPAAYRELRDGGGSLCAPGHRAAAAGAPASV